MIATTKNNSKTFLHFIILAGWLLAAHLAAQGNASDLPAGEYTLDRSHASLLFRVNHLGFSMYTARFVKFDATLQFNPKQLQQSKLTVTVDATSLETDFPNPEVVDFNAELTGGNWLNTAAHPTMQYQSTKVIDIGNNQMQVEGLLTLNGITKPVSLAVTYNGGWLGIPQDPHARAGFSARGQLKRSEFNINAGIPAPGTTMGVSDDVDIIIEAEFSGPEWKQ